MKNVNKMHWLMHFLHAVEIVMYKHPNDLVRVHWSYFYHRAVGELHLNPETEEQLDRRLADHK